MLKRVMNMRAGLLMLLTLSFLFTFSNGNAEAKTIYMGPNESYKTLVQAFSAMTGGDTLIIRDGTYTGTDNQIRYNNKPPSGSSGSYTTVKANNDGQVVFDGQNSRDMLEGYGTFDMSYVTFEGLQFVNTPGGSDITGSAHNNRTAHHIKLLKCGFQHTLGISYASYVLAEDCYVVGKGRYGFSSFTSDHVVFRRCVARLDAANGNGMPISHYINYTSQDVEFQNCLAIDSDDDFYSNYEGIYGGFYVRKNNTIGNTTYSSTNTKIRGCMVLNVMHDTSGAGSPGEALSLGKGSSGTEIENSVWWDIKRGIIIDQGVLTSNYTVDHSVFGKTSYAGSKDNIMLRDSYGDISNSIFYGIKNSGSGSSYALYDVNSSVNNCFYNNDYNKSSINIQSGDLTGTDPTAGHLMYLPRIESESALLNGTASDGGDIGATIVKRIGTSETLHGDAGYNTTTNDNLWPWPQEDIIGTFFRTYGAASNPSPTRGFCSNDQTLTKYIWEYLGNPIPAGIYAGTDNDTPYEPQNLRVVQK